MTPADQFFALADATRCRVVEMLSDRPMPVHELTAAFSISRPAISRHLRVLKQARLVKEIKRGRENIYSLQLHNLEPMQVWLGARGSQQAPASPKKSSKVAVVRRAKAERPGVATSPLAKATAALPVVAGDEVALKPVKKPAVRPAVAAEQQAQLALF